MKNEIVANSCRVCLTKSKKLRSLYKPIDEGDEPPNEMLHLITGIQVEAIDEHVTLPKNICKNCELSLSMAFEFRVNALKTQEIIASYLNELNVSNCLQDSNTSMRSGVKKEYEGIMDIEPLDCVDTLDDDIAECNLQNITNDEHKGCLESDIELNEVINNEDSSVTHDDQEFYKQKENPAYLLKDNDESDTESYSDHQINENDERSIEYSQRLSDHQIDDEEDKDKIEETEKVNDEIMPHDGQQSINTKKLLAKSNNISKFTTKIYQKKDESLGEQIYTNSIENMKKIPRRGRKPINNDNHVGYICDICGNVFAKRGRMMEHRQRHDKELKYCCELCDQKFHTRELLRKHMFSHSGGKPLKCEYCSRTFYYESVRKAHEAVHKGHKPYICDVCGKAFGYAHALKKHKLIHAEIKLYRCSYCNKDFRLQHHMKQHELTKLHQNAVRFANYGNIAIDDCDGEADPNEIIEEQDLNEDILFIEEIADDQLASGS